MKLLLAVIITLSGLNAAYAQRCGQTVFNPTTGRMDCLGPATWTGNNVSFPGNVKIGTTSFSPTTGASGYALWQSVILPAISRGDYVQQVTVSSTIAAALASLSGCTSSARCKINLPAGSYNDCGLQWVAFVDMVGPGSGAANWTCTSNSVDTLIAGGINATFSGFTLGHVSSTTAKYPVHLDTATDATTAPNAASVTIFNDVIFTATGANAKQGIGVGTWSNQRYYFANGSASSTQLDGINAHNANVAQSLPSSITFLNFSATGATGKYGIDYSNQGTGKPDQLNIYGGSWTGGVGGINVGDTGSGAHETIVGITADTVGTVSLVSGTTQIVPPPFIYSPRPRDPAYEFTGPIVTGPTGTATAQITTGIGAAATPAHAINDQTLFSGMFVGAHAQLNFSVLGVVKLDLQPVQHNMYWEENGALIFGASSNAGIGYVGSGALGATSGAAGGISATIQAGVTATDPGCTTTAHVGKQWFDITTTTTVYKVCLNVAGTVGWVVK